MQEIQSIVSKEKIYNFKEHKTIQQLEDIFPEGYVENWFTIDNDGIIVENTFDSALNGFKF